MTTKEFDGELALAKVAVPLFSNLRLAGAPSDDELMAAIRNGVSLAQLEPHIRIYAQRQGRVERQPGRPSNFLRDFAIRHFVDRFVTHGMTRRAAIATVADLVRPPLGAEAFRSILRRR